MELRDSIDVATGNSGVLVLDSSGMPQYLPWRDVVKIDFEAQGQAPRKHVAASAPGATVTGGQ